VPTGASVLTTGGSTGGRSTNGCRQLLVNSLLCARLAYDVSSADLGFLSFTKCRGPVFFGTEGTLDGGSRPALLHTPA
jgi:hypothetical protein